MTFMQVYRWGFDQVFGLITILVIGVAGLYWVASQVGLTMRSKKTATRLADSCKLGDVEDSIGSPNPANLPASGDPAAHRHPKWKRYVFWIASIVCTIFALCIVFRFTVIGRTVGATHVFRPFNDPFGNEFLRELIMNGFLFVPLGTFLPYVLAGLMGIAGKRKGNGPNGVKSVSAESVNSPIALTICIAFVLSLGIEVWQYAACTGTAQASDVILNTLGAAIGSLSLLLGRTFLKVSPPK